MQKRIKAFKAEMQIRNTLDTLFDDIDDIAGFYSFLYPNQSVIVENDTTTESSDVFKNGKRLTPVTSAWMTLEQAKKEGLT